MSWVHEAAKAAAKTLRPQDEWETMNTGERDKIARAMYDAFAISEEHGAVIRAWSSDMRKAPDDPEVPLILFNAEWGMRSGRFYAQVHPTFGNFVPDGLDDGPVATHWMLGSIPEVVE